MKLMEHIILQMDYEFKLNSYNYWHGLKPWNHLWKVPTTRKKMDIYNPIMIPSGIRYEKVYMLHSYGRFGKYSKHICTMYIYIYVCVFILYIYIYVQVFSCILTYTHVHIYIYMYIYAHMYIYMYIYICTYVYIYICIKIYIYVYIHVQL